MGSVHETGTAPPSLKMAEASASADGYSRGPLCGRCGNPLKVGERTVPVGLDDPVWLLNFPVLHKGCRESLIRERMLASIG